MSGQHLIQSDSENSDTEDMNDYPDVSFSREYKEDLFRIECRNWLMDNGPELFVEKLKIMVEPERKGKAVVVTNKK